MVALAALSGSLFLLSPAAAKESHPFVGSIGAGELENPTGLAVDQATGSVYAADAGGIHKYDAAGAPASFSALGTNQIEVGAGQIAVDNSTTPTAGRILAAVGNNVRQFAPSGSAVPFASQSEYAVGNRLIGAPGETFYEVVAVAVDSNGYIYVAANSKLAIYDPQGKFVVSAPLFLPGRAMAVDSEGRIYGSEFASGQYDGPVVALIPDSYPVTPATTYTQSPVDSANSFGLAIDPADDDLYVNGNGVVEQRGSFPAGNALLSTFGSLDLKAGSSGLAIDRSGGSADGDVYVLSGNRVVNFGPLVLLPEATTLDASGVTSSGASLHGLVDPEGLAVTDCQFEYGLGESFDRTAPCGQDPAAIGTGTDPVAVSADVGNLAIGNYTFRLVVSNSNGAASSSAKPFSIETAPEVLGEFSDPSATEARLTGSLQSGNAPTAYHFEYGRTSAYGNSTRTRTLPPGTSPVTVDANVTGLTEGSAYHFRLVASNPHGSATGEDRGFTTSAGSGDACPNAVVRASQGSTGLPDCRAYEMVSPVEKNGNDVAAHFGRVISSSDGSGVDYSSSGAFAGVEGTGTDAEYVARRVGAGVWTTEGITPPQEPHGSVFALTPVMEAHSRDLSKNLMVSPNPPLTPNATPDMSNLYIRSSEGGPRWTLLNPPTGEVGRLIYDDSTPDLASVLFESSIPLLPGAPSGTDSLYLWREGKLTMPSVLPDGTQLAPHGSTATSFFLTGHPMNALTEDGKRMIFVAPTDSSSPTQVYLRDGDSITDISAPQRPILGPDPEGTKEAAFYGASPDGSRFFFISEEKLTEDSTAGIIRPDLYMYDVASGDLADLTVFAAEDQPTVYGANAGLLGTNRDGSFAYYFGSSAPDGTQDTGRFPPGIYNLYVWHDGETRQVGAFASEPTEIADTRRAGTNAAQVSADGKHLVFLSDMKLTEGDNAGQLAAYLYDFESDQLTCLSCPGDGSPQKGNADFQGRRAEYSAGAHPSLWISPNGSRVLFQTASKLVPTDTNGAQDVYLWEDGRPHLISSGTDPDPSFAGDMTADGSDVFFLTRQQLLRKDTDHQLDLYDARIDGGVIEASGAGSSCSEEGCLTSPEPMTAKGGIATAAAPTRAPTADCAKVAAQARAAERSAARLGRKAKKLTAAGRSATSTRGRQRAKQKQAKRLKQQTARCRGRRS